MMFQSPALDVHSRSTTNAEWVNRAKDKAIESLDQTIVIDLSHVDRINTHELGELIRLHLDMKREERELVLANVQLNVRRVLTLTRLHRLIHIEPAHGSPIRRTPITRTQIKPH